MVQEAWTLLERLSRLPEEPSEERDSVQGGPFKEEKEELKLQMELKLKLRPLEISL